MPDSRHQLAAGGAGNLRLHDVHGLGIRLWQHCQHKHQHTHAAYPVGEAAPEQDALTERLHVRQDAGACGGKAGDGFKKSIHKPGDLAADGKGQSAEQGKQDPAGSHDPEALLGVHGLIFGPAQCQKRAGHQKHGDDRAEGHGVLSIEEAHHQRQQHQPRLHLQQDAQGIETDGIIHGRINPSPACHLSPAIPTGW